MSIQVSNLSKNYGQQKAVDSISFSIGRGEIVGFLGPNGAGKSTTMKMITGYLQADGGTATVCGINVRDNALAAKQKIGYLAEANPLYYDMYVREYLSFVVGVYKIENEQQVIEETIALVGLTPEANKKIGQLSKGYKQRVGLAAALVHTPEVLILDEPTSGLDPNQIIEIRNVIKAQGSNKTVLFSSHILQEVQAICDRVIIINKGKLVADSLLSQLQQKSDVESVRVSFKEALESEWLQRLPAIRSIEKINTHTWLLKTIDATEARKQLLELSLKENLNIESLQTEGNSLEDIFRQLTVNPS
ncbi:MAG: gliding motility-associated ABC transporter ATP-binding subunit GldA [Filimonas sp.]|nr:gliding motility-associated ABC transporter ATP-binding subunit GldA [Filimonas sp.]